MEITQEVRVEVRGAALGSRRERPVPVGVKVKAKLQRGGGHFRIPIPCFVELTVLDVLRGKQCWQRLTAEGLVDASAANGHDYCLVQLRLAYSAAAKGTPPPSPYTFQKDQLVVVSGDGENVDPHPCAEKQPEPALIGESLQAGETREGWVVFQVSPLDKEPLLAFHNYTESGRAGADQLTPADPLWLKLYRFDPTQIECSGVECRV